jgi:GNAT superfamily N-acetyltransferase
MAKLEVRELSPHLLPDWLSFFDHEAFTDNPEWARCYCLFYHADHSERDWGGRSAANNRAASTHLVAEGRMRGYLAYLDGRPVGWCQANQRASIPNIANDESLVIDGPDKVGIGSIVCFVVAKPYRNLGVARRLLDAACADFLSLGLEIAEAYPRREATSDASNYHGPLQMFLDAGFSPYRELEKIVIVRRPLKSDGHSPAAG